MSGIRPKAEEPSGRDPLQQRSWTAEDGSARTTLEVLAEELGPGLGGRRRRRPGRLQVRWHRDSGRFFAFVLVACAHVCFNQF